MLKRGNAFFGEPLFISICEYSDMLNIKKSALALALTAAIGSTGAQAGKVEELEAMMIRMQAQMEQLQAELKEAKTRADDAQAMARASSGGGAAGGGFGPGVTLSGVLDIQANHQDPFATGANTDTSDLAVAEGSITVEAQVNNWVSGVLTMKYEEGANGDNMNADEALIVLGNDASPATMTLGKTTFFGAYETNMISDPLTLGMGEIGGTYARVDVGSDGFTAGGWLYNGDTSKATENADELNHYGFSLGFGQETATGAFAVGLDYASDVSDSGGLSGALGGAATTMADNVSGTSVYGSFSHGDLSVMGEYLAVNDSFQVGEIAFAGRGAKPEAWHIEAAHAVQLGQFPGTVALGFGGTDEAQALGLAEERIIAALAMDIAENTTLAFEWNHEEDYSVAEGGTGNDQNTYTVQVAVSF